MKVDSWTDARYWGFIRSALRKGFQRYPNKYLALKLAKVDKDKYACAECKGVFPKREVSVDHIKSCGTLKSYLDLPVFIERLFCYVYELQVLCRPCHAKKTLRDRGFTATDIKLIAFRNCNAEKQKRLLTTHGIENVGSNKQKREAQYLKIVEENELRDKTAQVI